MSLSYFSQHNWPTSRRSKKLACLRVFNVYELVLPLSFLLVTDKDLVIKRWTSSWGERMSHTRNKNILIKGNNEIMKHTMKMDNLFSIIVRLKADLNFDSNFNLKSTLYKKISIVNFYDKKVHNKENRGVFRSQSNIYDGGFLQK